MNVTTEPRGLPPWLTTDEIAAANDRALDEKRKAVPDFANLKSRLQDVIPNSVDDYVLASFLKTLADNPASEPRGVEDAARRYFEHYSPKC
jgi:hypothetical protein